MKNTFFTFKYFFVFFIIILLIIEANPITQHLVNLIIESNSFTGQIKATYDFWHDVVQQQIHDGYNISQMESDPYMFEDLEKELHIFK